MKATVEIVVRNGKMGLTDSQRTLQAPAHWVQRLIEQTEIIIAKFPPKQIRVSQVINGSAIFVAIEVGMPDPRQTPRLGPTFETLYRADGHQHHNASAL